MTEQKKTMFECLYCPRLGLEYRTGSLQELIDHRAEHNKPSYFKDRSVWLPQQDASVYVGMSISTLYRLGKSRQVLSVVDGGFRLYHRTILDALPRRIKAIQ